MEHNKNTEGTNYDESSVTMKSPPENLCVGHNLAYIYLYTAKYNDWNITIEEFQETYRVIKYWMGDDTSFDELKEVLIQTDEWFQSGSNMERTIMLEKIIDMLYNSEEFPNKFFPDIFEDCIRVTAANNERLAKKIPKLPSRINLSNEELVSLFDEYPLLRKMRKLLRIDEDNADEN